jgi:hypothetical protein
VRRLTRRLLLVAGTVVAMTVAAPGPTASAVESSGDRTVPEETVVERPSPDTEVPIADEGARSPEAPLDGPDEPQTPEARPAPAPDVGPPVTEDPVVVPPESSDRPLASSEGVPPLVWAAGAVAAVAGAFALGSLTAARRRTDPHPAPAPAPRSDAPASEVPAAAVRQRQELVGACIEVRDLVGSQALAGRLGSALERAGVVTVDPTGELFDHRYHRAVHVSDTDDVSLDARIARVERVGYADGARLLRPPEVVVWRHAQREPAT